MGNWLAAPKVPSPAPSSTDALPEVSFGDRQVGVRVAVEAADRNRKPGPARGEAGGGTEAATAPAEEDRDGVVNEVGDRKVGVRVAVELADRNRRGITPVV